MINGQTVEKLPDRFFMGKRKEQYWVEKMSD